MARVEQELAGRQPGNRFIQRIQALDKTAAQTRSGMRYSVIILSVVGMLVLAVTMIGVADLAAFNVTTCTKQLGTRRAIGATKFMCCAISSSRIGSSRRPVRSSAGCSRSRQVFG